MSSHHHLNPTSGEVEHINFLSEDIGALYLSDDYSDVTLLVCGQRFNAHRVILAARSQYFRALLFGGLKESMQDEIELKGTTLPAFKGLLKYIYTGHMSLANLREEVCIKYIDRVKLKTKKLIFLSAIIFFSPQGNSRYFGSCPSIWISTSGSRDLRLSSRNTEHKKCMFYIRRHATLSTRSFDQGVPRIYG